MTDRDKRIRSLLDSPGSSDRAQGIALLVMAHDFSSEFREIIGGFVNDDTPTSFHVPLSALARAYLIMSGDNALEADDRWTAYMLDSFKAA
ncbi:hypothetical protein [uncultured Parolsenella sp.]|uniref:hypothetical protein n=1 Tax=uncultured Parolsenella sp. TaxID=2083008 RepID=UPI0027D96F64|nr:hypothetical protein [uncultured Parolsenella sp.]